MAPAGERAISSEIALILERSMRFAA